MLPRSEVERRLKQILSHAPETEQGIQAEEDD
jgi:hypothetical protein